jgi:hypothetical protein
MVVDEVEFGGCGRIKPFSFPNSLFLLIPVLSKNNIILPLTPTHSQFLNNQTNNSKDDEDQEEREI